MGITNWLSRFAGGEMVDESVPPDTAVNQLFDVMSARFDKTAADGMASTTTSDTIFFTNPYDCSLILISARFITLGAGIAQDPANYATIQIKTDNGAGGATNVGLSLNSLTGDGGTATSNISRAFNTRTPANCTLVAGASLSFAITKTGTGVVVPISAVICRLRKAS